jgi:hypothetical protein
MQRRRGFRCIKVGLVLVLVLVVVVVESSGCGGFLPAAILSAAV